MDRAYHGTKYLYLLDMESHNTETERNQKNIERESRVKRERQRAILLVWGLGSWGFG